jgi:hypothetical protein
MGGNKGSTMGSNKGSKKDGKKVSKTSGRATSNNIGSKGGGSTSVKASGVTGAKGSSEVGAKASATGGKGIVTGAGRMRSIGKFWPYLSLGAVVAAVLAIGLTAYVLNGPKDRSAEKKSGADQKRASAPAREKKPNESAGEMVLPQAETADVTAVEEATATPDQPAEPEVGPATAAGSAAEIKLEPASTSKSKSAAKPASPATPAREPKPASSPAPAAEPEPAPGSTPPGGGTPRPAKPAPAPVIGPDTVLTAEQADSLQGRYPGISGGWTINQYNEAAAWFYARYDKWGGSLETTISVFTDFLGALDGRETNEKWSFPRSWPKLWSRAS